jgi:uncharacterized sulfatase
MTYMEQAIEEEKPFFIHLSLHAVHIPLDVDAPEVYRQRFDTGFPSVDRFYSHVYAVDQGVQRMVEMLKQRGAWENTLLVFLSDNGATCNTGRGDLSLIPGNGTHQGHKGQLFLGGIRIPILMVWPEGIPKPQVIDRPVSTMDVLPTALEAAGGEAPEGIDGKSLLPLIEDPEVVHHERLIWAGIHAPAWGHSSAYTLVNAQKERDRWPGGWAILEDDYLLRFVGTLAPGLESAYPNGCEPYYRLHHIGNDPLEENNLYDQLPEVVERMKASYLEVADTLPPPLRFRYEAWAELVPHPEQHPPRDE